MQRVALGELHDTHDLWTGAVSTVKKSVKLPSTATDVKKSCGLRQRIWCLMYLCRVRVIRYEWSYSVTGHCRNSTVDCLLRLVGRLLVIGLPSGVRLADVICLVL